MAEPSPPPEVMTQYGLAHAEFIIETGQAKIWRVKTAQEQDAALKLYKSGSMGNESAGFVYLDALKGQSASHIYAHTASLGLSEWLEGPVLSDLARTGQDHAAAAHLCDVARRIHATPLPSLAGYPKLEDWFAPLFQIQFDPRCAQKDKANMLRAQQIARALLASQQDIRPLHGDLHHDNIRLTARGYCCFDAKGVLGERAYELANAFRHPRGADALVRDMERIVFLRDMWSEEFDVAPKRLMQWACAKLGLSIAWRSKGVMLRDAELDLLECFLASIPK